MSPRTRRVTASEVGQYAYCAYAWWLATVEKREPVDPGLLDMGTRAHERHGFEVWLARGAKRLALTCLGIAVIALLVWTVAAFAR